MGTRGTRPSCVGTRGARPSYFQCSAFDVCLWNTIEEIDNFDKGECFDAVECFRTEVGTEIDFGFDGGPAIVAEVVPGAGDETDRG